MQDFNLGEAILRFFGAYWNLALWVVTVAVGAYAFWKIVFDREDRNVTSAAPESNGLRRLWRIGMQAFGNWQLAVLGTTAILLSLVSGYTTWDGLRNLTQQL